MKIYHLNCGTMRPMLGGGALTETGSLFRRGRAVLHTLLIDAGEPFLVDSGWGMADLYTPTPVVRIFRRLLGDPLDENETAIRQVEKLGYHPSEIRHIVVTHLHLDHPGGIADFPHATIHIYQPEYLAYQQQAKFGFPYVAQHTAHQPNWRFHTLTSPPTDFFGFPSTPAFQIGATEVRFVPLVGHSPGMAAVAIRTPLGWFLHCADAYGFGPYVDPHHPRSPHGIGKPLYAILACLPIGVAQGVFIHVPRLRQLFAQHPEIEHCCSHDPHEYDRQAAQNPAPKPTTPLPA